MGPAIILGAAALIGGGALLGGLLGKKKEETTNNYNFHGNQGRSPQQRRVDRNQNGRISALEQQIAQLQQQLQGLRAGAPCQGYGLPSTGCCGTAAFSGVGGGAAVAGFFHCN